MIIRHLTRLGLILPLLLAGCVDYQIIDYGNNPASLTLNTISFNHPFTDKGFSEVGAEAKKRCALRDKLAIQTSKACTLSTCFTTYQCTDKTDVIKYGDQPEVVK